MKRPWIAVGLAVALMTGVNTPPAQADEGSVFLNKEYQELGTASSKTGGVVAAGNREAALAGLKMLDDGGNAVDAVAAAMFAVGVAQFDSCGMGGGGFLVYRSASGEVDTIDFREWSPNNYVYTNGFGISGTGLYAWGGGHNVVGIPGSVAGIDLALTKHGTRSLMQDPLGLDPDMSVLDPAIDLAVNGFTVPKFSADYVFENAARLSVFPATAAIYMGAPAYYKAGEKMRNLPLAEDMLELKRLGAEAFYNPLLPGGTIAADLLAEMTWRPSPFLNDRPDGSGWQADDLTQYRAIPRPAVRTGYRGSEYIGMAAPAIVVRHGKPTLVTGGIGGAGIIAGTASAVINVVDFRQDVAHAIDAERAEPRGNCPPVEENFGRQLCLETTRFDADVLDDLRRRGHTVMHSSAIWQNPCFGVGECEYAAQPLTHSAGVHPRTGERQAASDPRSFAAGQPTGLAAVAQAGGG